MRYITVLLGTLILLAVSGCKTTQRVDSGAPVAASASAEAPLPAFSPFDDIADDRVVYSQSYREGYRSGFPGFAAPPWAQVGVRYHTSDPRTRGWRDGALAARLAASAKLEN